MRYRPFGNSGKAVSALSVLLRETPALPTTAAWRSLVFSAMENGVNCFEGVAGSEAMAKGLSDALEAVERRLIFLAWRIPGELTRPLTPELLSQQVRTGLGHTGAGYFDVLMLDERAFVSLTADAAGYLVDLRASGLVLQVGVVGNGPAIDQAVASSDFDVLSMPFSMLSDSGVRRRVKEAEHASMAAMAYDPFPPELLKTHQPSMGERVGSFLRREREHPLAGAGTYAFLHQTHGWTAEELCFGYALTEPAFATVQVEGLKPEAIERLAAVTDKDLPTAVTAQIEMARFGARQPEPQQKRA